MKYKLSPIQLFVFCFFLTSCGSLSYRDSYALSKSYKDALRQYRREIESAMNHIEKGRSDIENKVAIDSAINAMILGKESDTIFIVEECFPTDYIYSITIWDRTSSFNVSHRSDYFSKSTYNCLHYRLVDLISEWNPKNIISESNLRPMTYYENYNFFQVATRMIFRKQKLTDSQSIIYREINFYPLDSLPYMYYHNPPKQDINIE